MAKQVRETTAGGAISAFVVLNKKGEHVATVQAYYAGRVSVDVWNHGTKATARCFATARKTGKISDKQLAAIVARAPDYYKDDESRQDWATYDLFGLQQGNAGGYGYDKCAAALAGLLIDGHTIADHCGQVPEAEKARAKLLAAQLKAGAASVESRREWDSKAAKIGAHFCNWDSEKNAYGSLHFEQGLKRLGILGYRVIQAI